MVVQLVGSAACTCHRPGQSSHLTTILADAVTTQDTVTQLVSAVRRVAREVPGAAEQIAGVCTGHDYSRPGKPKIDWDDLQARGAGLGAGQRRQRAGGGAERR